MQHFTFTGNDYRAYSIFCNNFLLFPNQCYFLGAVASSAPIQAQTDFPEYLEVSTDSLGTQQCKDSVKAATTSVENYAKTESGRKLLTNLFQFVFYKFAIILLIPFY